MPDASSSEFLDTQVKQLTLWNQAKNDLAALQAVVDSYKMRVEAPVPGWKLVYENAGTLKGVDMQESNASANAKIKPSDNVNKQLQIPSVKDCWEITQDPRASDGVAISVWTRKSTFSVAPGKNIIDWANGRGKMGPELSPPLALRVRCCWPELAVLVKSALMWWPNEGWPWEIDFVEPGKNGLQINLHVDQDGDGQAREQKQIKVPGAITDYHTWDVIVLPDSISIKCDGVAYLYETDPHWLIKGPGRFSIGKALTGRRDDPKREDDELRVDLVQMWVPASAA